MTCGILLAGALVAPPHVGDRGCDPGDRAGAEPQQLVRHRRVRVGEVARKHRVERGEAVAVVPAVVDEVPGRDHHHHHVWLSRRHPRRQVVVEPAIAFVGRLLPAALASLAATHESAAWGANDVDLGELGMLRRPRQQPGGGRPRGRVAGNDDPHRLRERRKRGLGRRGRRGRRGEPSSCAAPRCPPPVGWLRSHGRSDCGGAGGGARRLRRLDHWSERLDRRPVDVDRGGGHGCVVGPPVLSQRGRNDGERHDRDRRRRQPAGGQRHSPARAASAAGSVARSDGTRSRRSPASTPAARRRAASRRGPSVARRRSRRSASGTGTRRTRSRPATRAAAVDSTRRTGDSACSPSDQQRRTDGERRQPPLVGRTAGSRKGRHAHGERERARRGASQAARRGTARPCSRSASSAPIRISPTRAGVAQYAASGPNRAAISRRGEREHQRERSERERAAAARGAAGEQERHRRRPHPVELLLDRQRPEVLDR